MIEFIYQYSGILGVLAGLYAIYKLREEPTPEKPNPNNLGAYLAGIFLAVAWYYIIPVTIIFAIQSIATYIVGIFAAFVFFVPLLIVIAAIAFWGKSSNKVRTIIIGFIFIFAVIGLLGGDNVSNTIAANIEDFNYCLTSKRMHDVRYELIYPAEGTTEGDYYKLKERYLSLYDEREKSLKNYHKVHQSLVNKDCLLQNFDHLTSYLFSTTLEAIRAEERVLVNGGSLEEALQAYEKMR